MASTAVNYRYGTPFPFLKLSSELRNCVYRFVIPYNIRPCASPSQLASEDNDEHKLLVSLFLINKQFHQEISHVLYQYSHFLVSIREPRRLPSSIFWESYQPDRFYVNNLVSRIKHVDIDLEWAQNSTFLLLFTRLEPVCEKLRVFPSLQTITVRWKKDGNLNSRPLLSVAIFVLEPLEELQTDLPNVQVTVQAEQQERNNENDDNDKDLKSYIELPDYLSELRERDHRDVTRLLNYQSSIRRKWNRSCRLC